MNRRELLSGGIIMSANALLPFPEIKGYADLAPQGPDVLTKIIKLGICIERGPHVNPVRHIILTAGEADELLRGPFHKLYWPRPDYPNTLLAEGGYLGLIDRFHCWVVPPAPRKVWPIGWRISGGRCPHCLAMWYEHGR